jgi:class 3 adenylate cyclase
MQPTVIGDTVNVAARLCGQCEPGEVVLGEQTVDSPEIAKRLRLTPMPPRPLKGRRQPVTPNRADTLAPEHQSQLTELLDRILPTEDSE